jgi:hypothetical protein
MGGDFGFGTFRIQCAAASQSEWGRREDRHRTSAACKQLGNDESYAQAVTQAKRQAHGRLVSMLLDGNSPTESTAFIGIKRT